MRRFSHYFSKFVCAFFARAASRIAFMRSSASSRDITQIGVAARAGYGELIAWTVGELLEAFYRGGGKVRRSGERPGDWELIRRACRWISGAAIPWRVPSGNVQPWAIMTLRFAAW